MAAQHKRPGRSAKQARRRRAQERDKVVTLPDLTGKGYCRYNISPGRCVAWADGRDIRK